MKRVKVKTVSKVDEEMEMDSESIRCMFFEY